MLEEILATCSYRRKEKKEERNDKWKGGRKKDGKDGEKGGRERGWEEGRGQGSYQANRS
jgi:hypothetical protein